VRAAQIARRWQRLFGRSFPEKIIGIGLNYRDHAEEQGIDLPEEPLLFGKFANALCDPGESIVLPGESEHVDAEAELVVVIGREGRRISADSPRARRRVHVRK
jgi:2-keto-4-pentenoate hydratase/2-oxohepta-3-ene-1,7-dioic acid hydratase in catechol pathway